MSSSGRRWGASRRPPFFFARRLCVARARGGATSRLLRVSARDDVLLLLLGGGFGGRLAAALRGASGAFRFRARRRLLGVGGLGIRRFLGGARSRRRPRRRRLFARLLDRRFAVLLDRRFAVLPDRFALGPGRDVPLGRFDPRRSHDLAEALRPRAGEHPRTLLPPLASSRARPPGGAAAAAPGASRGLGVPVADEERERGSRVRRRLELLELLLVVVVVVVIVIVVVGVPLLLLLLLLAQTADVAALLLRAPPRLRRLVPLRRPLVVVLPGVVPHPGGGSGGFFAGGGGGAEGRLALPETSRRRPRRRRARHRVDHLRVRLLARGGGARLEVQVRLQERRDGLVVLLELEDVLARARVHGLREEVAVLVAVRGDGVDLLERELRLARQPGAYVVLALRRADDALVQTPNQVVVLHQGQVVVQKPAEGVARRGEFVRLEAGFVAVLRAQAVVGVAAHAETVVDDAELVRVALPAEVGGDRGAVPHVARQARDGLVPEIEIERPGVVRRAHAHPVCFSRRVGRGKQNGRGGNRGGGGRGRTRRQRGETPEGEGRRGVDDEGGRAGGADAAARRASRVKREGGVARSAGRVHGRGASSSSRRRPLSHAPDAVVRGEELDGRPAVLRDVDEHRPRPRALLGELDLAEGGRDVRRRVEPARPRHRDDAQDRDRARGGERRAKDPRRAPGPFGPRRPRSGAIAPPGGSRQEGRALAPVAHRAYGAPRRRAIRLEHHGAAAAEANTLQSRAGCYYYAMARRGRVFM